MRRGDKADEFFAVYTAERDCTAALLPSIDYDSMHRRIAHKMLHSLRCCPLRKESDVSTVQQYVLFGRP